MNHARALLKLARATFDPACRAGFESAADYLRSPNCLCYVGWVGHANLGDEWIYEGIKRLLQRWRLIATEWGYQPQMRLYARMALRKSHPFAGRLLGGGTLIPRANYLRQIRQPAFSDAPLYVFGTGMLDEDFWKDRLPSDFSTESLALWRETLSTARFIGVRDDASRRALEALGVRAVEVTGDAAFALGDDRWIRSDHTDLSRRRVKIGVNLGCSDPMWGDPKRLVSEVVTFLHACQRRGWEATYIPLARQDVAIGRIVQRQAAPNALRLWHDYRDSAGTIDALLSQDVVVGQRLHSVVLPSAYGVPTVSLAYNPKCLGFARSMDRSEYAIRTDQVTSGRILASVDRLLAGFETESQKVWQKAIACRATLQRAATRVLEDLGGR